MALSAIYKKSLRILIPIFGLFTLAILKFESDIFYLLAACSMALTAVLVRLFKYDNYVYYGLVVCLLISLEVPLLGSSKISLPDEILIVLLAMISWILIVSQDKFTKKMISSPIFIAVSLHILVFILSSVFSTMTTVSFKFSLINILYISSGLIVTAFLLQEEKINFHKLVATLSLPIVAICLYTIIHFAPYNFSPNATIIMAQPFFKDHTILSTCLALLLPLFLFYPFVYPNKNRFTKGSAIFIAILILFIIFISSSRAAWLSLLCSGVFYMYVRLKGNFKTLIILSGTLAIGAYFFSTPIMQQLESNYNSSDSEHATIKEQAMSVTNISNDVSNLERINRWKCAIRMAQDKPILGFGPGTYQFQYLPYQRAQDKTRISVDHPFNTKMGYGGSAHSEYFLVLSEMGVAGLITWLSILFTVLYSYFRCRNEASKKDKYILDALMLALMSFFVHSFFNNFLNTAKTAILFWIFIGFILNQFTTIHKLEKKTNHIK